MVTEPSIGVVGLGLMGTRLADRLQQVGAEIEAGVDINEQPRDLFADEFDAKSYSEHDQMLTDTSLDAIVVTTPNRYHEPVATAALARGVHVLCEKPLAHTVESAESIVRADKESDAFCMVGFCNRFAPGARLFREKDEVGTFGEVDHIEANYVRRRGIPGLGSWFTDSELAGGGALLDLGPHAIDLALDLAGYPTVVEVAGHTRDTIGRSEDYADPDNWAENWETPDGESGVEEACSAYLRCDDGTTISLEVAWAMNRRSTKTFRVNGTNAGAELAIGGDTLEILDTGTGALDHYDDRTLSGNAEHDKYFLEARHFVRGVTADERPCVNRIEQALHVQRVIDAIYESEQIGSAVPLRADDAELVPSR